MAKKDFEINENKDLEKDKKIDEDWKSHHTTGDRYPDDAAGIGETDVKNAHASGDGSFGRSDGSLPEGGENESKKTTDNAY
ncbi:MAG TPA: hypothetical protein VER36_11585 [Flavisolibacter sp.]|nr:hypothetical protein [Flavisolibacter sp.]